MAESTDGELSPSALKEPPTPTPSSASSNSEPKRLYIGRLPRRDTPRDVIAAKLRQVFYGITDVICHQAGDDEQRIGLTNRGFCFVDFDTHGHAAAALHGIKTHQLTPFEHPLYADWSMPLKQELDDEVQRKLHTLFVLNLDPCQTEIELATVFQSTCDGFVRVRKKTHGGYAFIEFNSHENAETALLRFGGKSGGGQPMIVAGKPLPELTWAHPDMNQNNKNSKLRVRKQQRLREFRERSAQKGENRQNVMQCTPQLTRVGNAHALLCADCSVLPLPSSNNTVNYSTYGSEVVSVPNIPRYYMPNNYVHMPMPLVPSWPVIMPTLPSNTGQNYLMAQGAAVHAPNGSRVVVLDPVIYNLALREVIRSNQLH